MLRYLDVEERGLSRDLWREAFPEDSEQFDDYYFTEKLKDNRILVIQEDGRIQSMVQLNPYLVQTGARKWRVDYIVGVATRKDKRHQGYMRKLLVQMMADMHGEMMPYCFLMPIDEAIYRPFGFTNIFEQPRVALKDGAGQLRVAELRPGQTQAIADAAEWMNRWLDERYQVYAVRDEAYLVRLLKELGSEDGSLELLYDRGRLVGMQSFWGLGEKEQRLLYAEEGYVDSEPEDTGEASAVTSTMDLSAAEVSGHGDKKPGIMARIIAVQEMVKVIHLKKSVEPEELVIRLKLVDPLIEENDGAWLWHLNHETSWLERDSGETKGKSGYLELRIEELTAWLFGYRVPEAAQEHADVVQVLQGVFLDEVV